MKITERMQEIQNMIDESPDSLGIMLPVHSVNELLQYCEDRAELQGKYTKARTRAKYYEEVYTSAKAELKRRKSEYATSLRRKVNSNGHTDESSADRNMQPDRELIEY